jgi:hypothetical protein
MSLDIESANTYVAFRANVMPTGPTNAPWDRDATRARDKKEGAGIHSEDTNRTKSTPSVAYGAVAGARNRLDP